MKLLFYIKRNALQPNGYAPIMGRITLGGQRAQFSTRLSIPPTAWDHLQHRAIGRNEEMIRINRRLDTICEQAFRCYEALLGEELHPTSAQVRDRLFATELSQECLLALIRRHNEELLQQVGIERSLSTYYKYSAVEQHLAHFIRDEYDRDDLLLGELDHDFLIRFHRRLQERLACRKNTVWVYLTALKHLLAWAREQGMPVADIFANYKLRSEFVVRQFLTTQELIRLITLNDLTPTQRLVRDSFLFSCFTGLSFIDLKRLQMEHIHRLGQQYWIETARSKTGSPVQVRLFDLPLAILRKYEPHLAGRSIFPLPSNNWCNRCLADLMRLAEIEKRITFHAARHTFATTLTLAQGIPIEMISKMLGHTNIRTTQIYATITHDYLDTAMSRLSKRLDPIAARWQA